MLRLIFTLTVLIVLVTQTARAEDPAMLTALGFGTVDSGRFSGAQAKMLSRRAAVVDAQRNLVEVVDGVRITSGTTVKDMTLESDVIGTRVKGMLQGAFIVNEKTYQDEGAWVAEVEMAVCLSAGPAACLRKPTLTSLVQPMLQAPAPEERFTVPLETVPVETVPVVTAPVSQALVLASAVESEPAAALADAPAPDTAAVVITGLIVDVSSQDFSPLLDVRIHTGAGKELYGPGHVARGTDWLHWSNSVANAKAMSDVVGDNPMLVSATAVGPGSEILVSQADAVSIFTQNLEGGDFLKSGKVIFVVN